MFHIYTGESKGKTTASVGLCVRARGAGLKVLFVSYFKPDGSSEHEELQKIGVEIMATIPIWVKASRLDKAVNLSMIYLGALNNIIQATWISQHC